MTQLDIAKALDFKRLLMAVAMVAIVVNSAWAAELTPKSDVTLKGDNLTVGDIFDGVDHDASYVLAPAPGYNQTMTLGAKDLQRISDAFNLGWTPVTGLEQTLVHRSSHDIDRYAIEAAVKSGLEERLRGQKLDVELNDRNMAFEIPDNLPATAEVQNLRFDTEAGTFDGILVAPAGAAHPVVRQDVAGKIFPVVSLPVLRSAMRQGDTITASDIDHVDVRASNVASSTIVEDSHLIGMSPRKGLLPLKPVSQSDIVPPQVVKKGDTITMEMKCGMMILTMQGKALDGGAEGESVRVENTTSSHVVQAVVTGIKQVSVASPDVSGGT